MTSLVYRIIHPPVTSTKLPIVLSVPHAGTMIPQAIQSELKEALLPADDTDWFVDQLYEFAPQLGITMIVAQNSRWVIDLNRDPAGKPLYQDGRVITGLCPATNFLGEPIYKDARTSVAEEEVARRRALYFDPYHSALNNLLQETKTTFGHVLLWDCHSIRKNVPSISNEPFADLILGTVDGTSAAPEIIANTVSQLQNSSYSFSMNNPFKGGFITRCFGKPEANQHALQLEMAKVNYMDDREERYDAKRAASMQSLLIKTILSALP